jgi:hypothetical protein
MPRGVILWLSPFALPGLFLDKAGNAIVNITRCVMLALLHLIQGALSRVILSPGVIRQYVGLVQLAGDLINSERPAIFRGPVARFSTGLKQPGVVQRTVQLLQRR